MDDTHGPVKLLHADAAAQQPVKSQVGHHDELVGLRKAHDDSPHRIAAGTERGIDRLERRARQLASPRKVVQRRDLFASQYQVDGFAFGVGRRMRNRQGHGCRGPAFQGRSGFSTQRLSKRRPIRDGCVIDSIDTGAAKQEPVGHGRGLDGRLAVRPGRGAQPINRLGNQRKLPCPVDVDVESTLAVNAGLHGQPGTVAQEQQINLAAFVRGELGLEPGHARPVHHPGAQDDIARLKNLPVGFVATTGNCNNLHQRGQTKKAGFDILLDAGYRRGVAKDLENGRHVNIGADQGLLIKVGAIARGGPRRRHRPAARLPNDFLKLFVSFDSLPAGRDEAHPRANAGVDQSELGQHFGEPSIVVCQQRTRSRRINADAQKAGARVLLWGQQELQRSAHAGALHRELQ